MKAFIKIQHFHTLTSLTNSLTSLPYSITHTYTHAYAHCSMHIIGMPAAGTVDVVTFSYALTMIPDWRAAIRNAFRMLKPGGHIAVCDFTVTKEQWFGMSAFWTFVFSNDHVHLNSAHIPTLKMAFETVTCKTGFGTFPYVPSLLQCPYYYYVGKKVDKECKI